MTKRQSLKGQILDIVKDNKAGSVPQHLLIVGSEGTGKTFIVADLVSELELSGKPVKPLYYPHCDIVTAGDIIGEVELSRYEQFILLIDDFDQLLLSLPNEEQYMLRSFLFRKGAPMLIATSTGVYNGFDDYRAPFYDAFRVLYIPELEAGDLVDLLPQDVYEDVKYNQQFLSLLPWLDGNINYINTLASGIHSGLNIDEALNQVVDENSRFFRHMFDSLPGMQQRALYALAQVVDAMNGSARGDERAATSAQVQQKSELSPANTASALFRLEKQGIIERVGEKKRNVSYQIKDYVFELWLR